MVYTIALPRCPPRRAFLCGFVAPSDSEADRHCLNDRRTLCQRWCGIPDKSLIPERGGVRPPLQAEAGGTSHRHQVSGPRGCRALPLHFPRCSLGALRRNGAAMASGEAASA
jgi:hypothetical protein